jgi:uncharacterized OsmC-like protein
MAEQLNDVNVAKFKEMDGMLRDNPALAKATFKLKSSWQRGTKTLIEIGTIQALGQDIFPKTRRFWIMTDDPDVLGGVDSAPTPAETLVAALAGCLTSGIASNAAMFDVPLDGIDIDMEAAVDFRGLFGHDKSVRPGFSDIHYTVTIKSPAPEDKVRRCKETIDRKSPVRDTLANPVRITSDFVYKPR